MIITRKIEVFVCESDEDLRRSYYEKIYDMRNVARNAANAATSHLFMLDNKIPYLDEESKKSIQFVGTKGDKSSRQNAAYCLMSSLFKDRINEIGATVAMLANLAQYVSKNYQEDKKMGLWKRSLRSYKGTIPMPFQGKQFYDLCFAEYTDDQGDSHEGCFFTLEKIPFQMRFGRDRSGNRLIVERVISGEYKMCTSSLKFDGNKLYLLLCVDIPKREVKLDEKKTMYAYLGVLNPIICTCDVKAAKVYDSGLKAWEIGTKEEFNYRRRQIQEAVRRCQVNNRYSAGGKGRAKKCQAIERWHEKENNYVDTKLHTYSKMLVDMAVKHGCGKIMLMNQTPREDFAKEENQEGEPFVLRNWTYYGLKDKIVYKSKMVGIKVVQDKEEKVLTE